MTTKTLIKNANVIVTMDGDRRELKDGFISICDGAIQAVGVMAELTDEESDATNIIDAQGSIVTPGLVNTHHHLFQSLTRTVAQDALLFGWLQTLYPIWSKMTPEDFTLAAQIGLAELTLSGCTLSSDHHYIYPNGVRLEDSISAAETVGLRFHATRGSMSIGESKGGLPPDHLVEDEQDIIDDTIRLIDQFHDSADGAMLRIGVAPCSPFSVSRELMRDSALLARDKGVMLHTHLAENVEDIAYSQSQFGCRPGDYALDLGWVGDDVWHAHCVQLDEREIDLFADTKTGVSHCPHSNCRLGSGIAPIRAMRDKKIPVSIGVDGSASNDSAHLLTEARQAMMLQRVKNGADAMSAREALEIATLGGANVLGRDDCGSIQVGKRADIAIWDMAVMSAAGAWDPVAALVLCGPFTPKHLLVEGRAIVKDGVVTTIDTGALLEKEKKAVVRLMNAA